MAHREDLAATASATLERSAGTVGGSWQEGGARAESPPLEGLAPPARRPHAPWEARARAARVQTRPAKTKRLYYPLAKTLLVVDWWWGGGGVVRTPTPNYLRQAFPDRGKYASYAYRVPLADWRHH